jgi:hypothetical protein
MGVRRERAFAAAAAVAAALALAGAVRAETVPVTVAAEPTQISTRLGDSFVFETTITNPSGSPSGPLIAHLNLLSLRGDVYVDPEDWSAQRTRYIGSVPAGESRTLTWKLKAVNGGRLAAYVAVLEEERPTLPPATSPTVRIDIATRDTLDAGGILPLALGIPAALALVAGGVRITRRRR